MFFFNDTATTEIYTLSLHDALPILLALIEEYVGNMSPGQAKVRMDEVRAHLKDTYFAWTGGTADRKSTRLNSRHANISHAVFCLQKNNAGVGVAGTGTRLAHSSRCV